MERMTLFGDVLFEISHKIRKLAGIALHYDVHVIAHDHITEYDHALMGNTIVQTFDNDIFITLPGEYVDPVHNGKGEEMGLGLVVYFIAITMHGLNIRNVTFREVSQIVSEVANFGERLQI